MEIRKIGLDNRALIAIILVAIGIVFRLLPHDPNFAPVGAIALFGGAVLGWKTALWLPIAIMASSDIFLGFYPGIFFTWTGFVLVGLFGSLLKNKRLPLQITIGALGSGVLFYAVSNLGVWLTSGYYPQTLAGLIDCYYMALPFFRSSLIADLFYATTFFGLYAAATAFAEKSSAAKSRSLDLQ